MSKIKRNRSKIPAKGIDGVKQSNGSRRRYICVFKEFAMFYTCIRLSLLYAKFSFPGFSLCTCPILRYATDGKNVLTIGKYEYRFVTCSAKRNVISLLGAVGVRFKILSNGATGTIGKIWLPIVKLRLPSLNYVQTVAKVDIFMRIESYSKLIKGNSLSI